MITRTILICWLLTVVFGSLFLGVLEHSVNDFGDSLEFGFMSMIVSAIFSTLVLVLMLLLTNTWLRKARALKGRLVRLHVVHLVGTIVTFGFIFLDGPEDDKWQIALACIPLAAVLWAFAHFRILGKAAGRTAPYSVADS